MLNMDMSSAEVAAFTLSVLLYSNLTVEMFFFLLKERFFFFFLLELQPWLSGPLKPVWAATGIHS